MAFELTAVSHRRLHVSEHRKLAQLGGKRATYLRVVENLSWKRSKQYKIDIRSTQLFLRKALIAMHIYQQNSYNRFVFYHLVDFYAFVHGIPVNHFMESEKWWLLPHACASGVTRCLCIKEGVLVANIISIQLR